MEGKSSREGWDSFLLPVALILGLALLLSFDMDSAPSRLEEVSLLEQWLRTMVDWLAALAEIAAALIIGVSVLRGLWGFLQGLVAPSRATHSDNLRLQLGRSLVLGLEFTVASDILQTAIAPTREDILILATVVLLRTLLNFLLEREIREVTARHGAVPATLAMPSEREEGATT